MYVLLSHASPRIGERIELRLCFRLLPPLLLPRDDSNASRSAVLADDRRRWISPARLRTIPAGMAEVPRAAAGPPRYVAAAASRLSHPGEEADPVEDAAAESGDDGVPIRASRRSTRAFSASTTAASCATVRGRRAVTLLLAAGVVARRRWMRLDRRRVRCCSMGVARFTGVPVAPRRTRHRPVVGLRTWFEWGQGRLGSFGGAPPEANASASAAAPSSACTVVCSTGTTTELVDAILGQLYN